tara:strand:- start:1393 stop:1551 length:159 start_codon:yes stop_codon:yes gene_type:complete
MAKKIKSKKLESDGNRFQKKMEKAFKQREAKKAKQAKKKAQNAGEIISIKDI